jgi:hypothetical protein
MHSVIIGSPDDVRVELFQSALAQRGCPPAEVVAYIDIINGSIHLSQIVQQDTLIRIESPGKSELANCALLALGNRETDEEHGYKRINPAMIVAKGRIAASPSRQWYLGLRAFMRIVVSQLTECPPHRLMNHPDDIILMFDKRACHGHLQAGGVNVPPNLPPVMNFYELEQGMHAANVRRVFIKLAHSSSASGVVAYQTNGKEHRATAAIEMVTVVGEIQLYNSRHVQTYTDHAQIVKLIDLLCQHRVHVEHWIPKAYMGDKAFDLRVVVIGGEVAHTVARLSHNPMTNLHLLNERRDREFVINWMGDESFDTAMNVCQKSMRCFPKSLYAGVDLLITPDYKSNFVLEMNAFGDLLHDTFYQGMDTYTLELEKVAYGQHAGNRWHA